MHGDDADTMHESLSYGFNHPPDDMFHHYVEGMHGPMTTTKLRSFVTQYILENPKSKEFIAYIGQTEQDREHYCEQVQRLKKPGNIEVGLTALALAFRVRILVHKLDIFTNEYNVQQIGNGDTAFEITFHPKIGRFNAVEDIITCSK